MNEDNNKHVKKNTNKKSQALQRNLLRRKGKLNNGCYQLDKAVDNSFDKKK